ncbi:MAG: ABC transporter ATP-binding protein [Pseudothermotoga sp.]
MKISCSKVSKSFRGKKVLEDVTFESQEKCIAFLGRNAVGKTTLLKIFATLIKPQTGCVKIDDIDLVKEPNKIRKILSFVPEKPSLIEELSACENIKHFANIRKIKVSAEQIMERFGIPMTSQPVKTFSKGLLQRVMIAIALMSEPQLVILDEPTSGLDQESTQSLWQLLLEMKKKGTTILLSTHDEAEVITLADYVVVLDEGKVAFGGHVSELPTRRFYIVQVEGIFPSDSCVLSTFNGKTSLLVEKEKLPEFLDQCKVLNVKNIGARELIELRSKHLL